MPACRLLPGFASLGPKRGWILALDKRFPRDRLAQDLDVIQIHFQGKALLGRSEGDDDFALLTKLRHDPLHTRENASMHAYDFPDGNSGMGPQNASAGQAFADPIDFNGAHRFAHATSQQAQNAGCAHDGHPHLAWEPHKNVSRKEGALKIDYTIRPFGSRRIKGKVMLEGAGRQMLCNSLFMVRDDMQNSPGTIEHRGQLLSRQQCKYIPESLQDCGRPHRGKPQMNIHNRVRTKTQDSNELPQQRDKFRFLQMGGMRRRLAGRER